MLQSKLARNLRREHTYQTPIPLCDPSNAIQVPSLPLQPTHSVHTTSDVEPSTFCGCFAGLIIAYVSDTSLHDFVTANKERQAAGQPKQQLLQTGEHPSMLFCTGRQHLSLCMVAKHGKCPLAMFCQKAAYSLSRAPATLMCLHTLMIRITRATS